MNKKIVALVIVILPLVLAGFPLLGLAAEQVVEYENDTFFLYEPEIPVYVPGRITGASLAVSSDAAILMDADTGQVLYAKNPHQKRPIASTTKIMTALVAIECGNLKDVVNVSPRAAAINESTIYLEPGEKLTLEELLYGALLRSGNDACVAIAEHVAGREDTFVGWMNFKAAKLGLKNTLFKNTNGLPNSDHLSTTYDLAVITRSALKNPVFNKVISTKSHVIRGPVGPRHLSNTNKMLWSYEGADGVKTGTTNAAGKCLVSSASRGSRRLIAVVLHSDNRWADSIRLLDYGFNGFESRIVAQKGDELAFVNVAEGVREKVPVGCSGDIVVTVPLYSGDPVEKIIKKEDKIAAPVLTGQVVGELLVLVDGVAVVQSNLVANGNVEKLPLHRLVYKRIVNAASLLQFPIPDP
ncbi:MAG: D-alanyl-D-alanine carboxypeptidase family protein [Bacillota bacterium]